MESTISNVTSEQKCQDLCQSEEKCTFYTFFENPRASGNCSLLSNCEIFKSCADYSNVYCHTGPKKVCSILIYKRTRLKLEFQ